MDSDRDSDTDSNGEITLIGSVHVSETYFDHVRSVIRDENPEIVAVELDKQRIANLFSDTDSMSPSSVFNQFSIRAGVLYLLLAYSQKRIANALGIDPDMNDMRVAVETAASTDSRVALLDRDITTTLERLSDKLGPITLARVWHRTRALDPDETPADSVHDLFDNLENSDVFTEYAEFIEQVIPELADPFIHERNEIMARRLYALEQSGRDVVAIVGGAHEPGIRNTLDTLRTTDDATGTAPTILRPTFDPDG